MKRLVEILIAKLKRQPGYRIQGDYSLFQLFMVFYYRFWQAVRGIRIKIIAGKTKGIVFAGKRVRIEHPYLFKAENNLIIEDNAFINTLSKKGLQVGRNVNIGKNAIIICSGVLANKGTGIVVGNNTAIGAQCFLGGQGGIEIGDDVIFGPGVRVFSENHNFSDPEIPIRLQGENRHGVKIGNNCWIGSGATILDGVSIGSGCVIAANSLVLKDIPDNTVYYNKISPVIKNRLE